MEEWISGSAKDLFLLFLPNCCLCTSIMYPPSPCSTISLSYPFYSHSSLALILFTVVSVNDLCQNEVCEREKEIKKDRKKEDKNGLKVKGHSEHDVMWWKWSEMLNTEGVNELSVWFYICMYMCTLKWCIERMWLYRNRILQQELKLTVRG